MQYLQSIQEIFQDKLFKIPDYQRGYAWEEKQWQDMIDDIEIMEDNQEHYTGTLVINLNEETEELYDDDGNIFRLYDVVDGQQRLTTISILLNQLSIEFSKFGTKQKQLAKGIKKKYIATTVNDDKFPKLTLNKDTNEFYKKNIIDNNNSISGAKILSEKRLQEAKEYFENYFKEKLDEFIKDNSKYAEEKYILWLEKIYSKITIKMKLTVYLVPQATDVGVIFEVMNNRGKVLTEMEKVKNYLLYISSKLTCNGGKELGENINKTWTYIFESLMSADAGVNDENQLLRFNWIMTIDYNSKNWCGSDSVKEKYNLKKYKDKHDELRNDVRRYVSLLKECCTAYCDIINPARENAFSSYSTDLETIRKIKEMSYKFIRVDAVASFIPILMATRIKYCTNIDIYLKVLDICEKFAFRVYRLEEKRSNAGQSALFKYGYNLFNDEVTVEETIDKIKKLILYYVPEEDFIDSIDRFGDDWYNWYGLKYVLYEYELYKANKNPVLMDWVYLKKKDKKDSIEHILPQTPNKEYWIKRWNKEEIDKATHDIGNLVMTFDNSVYSNKGFDEKKGKPGQEGCYANSSLFTERELAKFDEWTYKEFLKRRKDIAEWMKQRWDIKVDKKIDIEDDIDNEE
ncbi:MAG: DUF262 domain-containing HNH endonuclease family protein [Bacillales bacterium]|nr:DUF262 domain-containing HNH endonuclease family protein [Bacillales bacterium]